MSADREVSPVCSSEAMELPGRRAQGAGIIAKVNRCVAPCMHGRSGLHACTLWGLGGSRHAANCLSDVLRQ